jgi:hypothetical protein
MVLWTQDRRIHLDPAHLTLFCGLRIEGSTWILHPSQDFVASGSQDPPESNTPHRVLGPQDRRIHLDPTPLTRFCGLSIVGSIQIQHPSQGSTTSRSQEPPGSCTPHSVLWPQDRRIHQDPAPLTWFCGLRIEGSTWILLSSQGSVAPGSKDPPGSNTPHKALWPQDRRIHLDPTPFTWFCDVLWTQDRRSHLDPAPLTRFCGLRIEGSTWILHPSQGSGASGSQDPSGSYTPYKVQ